MFFQKYSDDEDPLYSRIRDHEEYENIRVQLETFWALYKNIAPKGFLGKIQRNGGFHQRWWELYCGVGLLRICNSVKINQKDNGPDFELSYNGRRCFVEAIAPKCGDTKDSLPPMEYGYKPVVSKLPENEFLLRITCGITEKAKKYKTYLDRGIVTPNDVLMIAISTCDLAQYGSLMDYPVPAPLKVLHGCGHPRFNLSTGEHYITKRDPITKKTGEPIPSNLFESEKMKIISGIIYSNTDPLNSPDQPERTFVIIKNPNSLISLDINMFNHRKQMMIY